jgi:hypothetical protein
MMTKGPRQTLRIIRIGAALGRDSSADLSEAAVIPVAARVQFGADHWPGIYFR